MSDPEGYVNSSAESVVTCFVFKELTLGSNISNHLSAAHGYTRQLTHYLLYSERIRRQQGPDLSNVKDCSTKAIQISSIPRVDRLLKSTISLPMSTAHRRKVPANFEC